VNSVPTGLSQTVPFRHVLAFEGGSTVRWFEGNYAE
jgi:hypothetical protein